MAKILLIHHLEPCWNVSMQKYGTSFKREERRAAAWIRKNKPDRVILTRFEHYRIDSDDYPNLIRLVDNVEEYGYGWSDDIAGLDHSEFVAGGTHSQYVWVPNWIRQLKGNIVRVFGAFRGECLEDIEIALTAAKVNHKFVNSMCIG